jgi:hypothetical protein
VIVSGSTAKPQTSLHFGRRSPSNEAEPDWLDQEIYVHDAGLDMQLPGNHELYVLPM